MSAFRYRAVAADDSTFFASNPGRIFRIRRSQPFEITGWGKRSHLDTPWMIVRLNGDGTTTSQPAKAFAETPGTDSIVEIPDTESSLSALWAAVQIRQLFAPGQVIEFSPGEVEAIFGAAVPFPRVQP